MQDNIPEIKLHCDFFNDFDDEALVLQLRIIHEFHKWIPLKNKRTFIFWSGIYWLVPIEDFSIYAGLLITKHMLKE